MLLALQAKGVKQRSKCECILFVIQNMVQFYKNFTTSLLMYISVFCFIDKITLLKACVSKF